MGEVVRFIPKSELERARLIREARAEIREHIPDGEGPHQGGEFNGSRRSKVHQ